jgi:heat shock protein HslJ
MAKKQNIDPMLSRQWMLIEFKDYPKQYLIDKKAEINLVEKNRCNIFMGCNRGSYEVSINTGNNIKFSNGVSTEMACEDMKLETDMQHILPEVISYKLEGHFLHLYTKSSASLKFVAADWD